MSLYVKKATTAEYTIEETLIDDECRKKVPLAVENEGKLFLLFLFVLPTREGWSTFRVAIIALCGTSEPLFFSFLLFSYLSLFSSIFTEFFQSCKISLKVKKIGKQLLSIAKLRLK